MHAPMNNSRDKRQPSATEMNVRRSHHSITTKRKRGETVFMHIVGKFIDTYPISFFYRLAYHGIIDLISLFVCDVENDDELGNPCRLEYCFLEKCFSERAKGVTC